MSHFSRLGTENIGKLLREMSSQTTLSLMVYAIYGITDTYFLSIGINSLAAAGASIISPVLILIGGVTTTVGAGGASVVSRALGENNPDRASRTVANTFMIFWVVATTLTVMGATFIEPIVYLLGATENVAPYAIEYGRIIFLGALTSTGYSAIVRADGNIRYSTAMWLIPVTTNIVLSWLFVMIFHWGAGGAALATILSQGISAGMGIYFFFFRKNRSYHIKKAYFNPDWSIIAEVILIGFPSFIKNFSASMVVVITNNLLNSMGGDSALSVFAIVNRLYSGLNTPQTGIVQGMQPIVGYNFGRKNFDRVRKTIAYSLGSSLVYGVVVGGLCLFFPMTLIGLLTTESAIITDGQIALQLMGIACPVVGISLMIAAYFQSVGRAKEALFITLGGIILIKLPVLLLASQFFSLTGIWASEAVSELILCIMSLVMLRHYQASLQVAMPAKAVGFD